MTKLQLCALAACAIGTRTARADSYIVEHDDTGYETSGYGTWTDPSVQTGIGFGVNVGGGITGFTDRTIRSSTSPVGGLWDLRATLGSHVPLALELGYLGTATQIQSLFGNAKGTMIGTAFEGDVRLNLMPHEIVDPYVFIGVGWQRYNIDEKSFQLSDTGIANRDDLLEVPMGAGLSYRLGGFVTDVRGTFRATQDANLVLESPRTGTGGFAPMHTWEASLSLGYEI